MGFFNRLSTGWALGTQCLGVIWNDKTLLLFPILSGIASAGFLAGVYFGVGPREIAAILHSVGAYQQGGEVPTMAVVLALGLYLGLSYITVFFNVALVGCARISMEERDSQLVDGLRVAMSHLGSILVWALISGSIGLLLSGLENGKRSGGIIRAILGTAWTVISYFVLPVMVVEKVNVFSSMRRSMKLIKRTWGEGIGAQFSLGWITFLLVLPVIFLFVLLSRGGAVAPALFILAAVYVIFTVILTQAAKQVLTVVLYLYATKSEVPKGFDQAAFPAAMR